MNAYSIPRNSINTWTWLLALAVSTSALAAPPAPTPVKPFRLIDTLCDASDSEISPKGQFVCLYVCRDTDHTKVAVVYSNSGSGQCRTPVKKTIKQTIKATP
ncbi:MAG: hypothetical protein QE283_12410 [Rhodoferax sp.]|nr:hypothetical protein [Rhodoferax sp.]